MRAAARYVKASPWTAFHIGDSSSSVLKPCWFSKAGLQCLVSVMKSVHLRRTVAFKLGSFQFTAGASCHCMCDGAPVDGEVFADFADKGERICWIEGGEGGGKDVECQGVVSIGCEPVYRLLYLVGGKVPQTGDLVVDHGEIASLILE
jgi:hypothetical protein